MTGIAQRVAGFEGQLRDAGLRMTQQRRLILRVLAFFVPLRVDAEKEQVGLDIAEHGEMLSPQS